MTHDEAIKRVIPMGAKSRANRTGFSAHLAFYEVCAGNGRNRESPDVIFFRNDGETDMIEVKVTREDFKRDSKKLFRKHPEQGMGKFRYYACPEGLIEEWELPPKWGLIYIPEGRKPAKIVKYSKEFTVNYLAERDLLFSLMRRCNDFFPLERCVEYDKIVKRETNTHMKAYGLRGTEEHRKKLDEIKATRRVFWEKMKKLIKYSRN